MDGLHTDTGLEPTARRPWMPKVGTVHPTSLPRRHRRERESERHDARGRHQGADCWAAIRRRLIRGSPHEMRLARDVQRSSVQPYIRTVERPRECVCAPCPVLSMPVVASSSCVRLTAVRCAGEVSWRPVASAHCSGAVGSPTRGPLQRDAAWPGTWPPTYWLR